jgi:hypothetical protein
MNDETKKSLPEFDDSDPQKDAKNERFGIFKVRGKKSDLHESTDHETSSVDLPTITVSEDQLHDTLSDVSDAEGSDLEEDIEVNVSNFGPSIVGSSTALDNNEKTTSKPPSGLSGFKSHFSSSNFPVFKRGLKRTSSNPSIETSTTRSSIKTKVKVLGGKFKEAWGGMSNAIHMRSRSRDDVSAEVSKILREAEKKRETESASAAGKTRFCSGTESPGASSADLVTVEVAKLHEIMKRDQELKRKEEELKKLEQLKQKESEERKKQEYKKLKEEEERIRGKELELKKREKEDDDKYSRKERELQNKEKELLTKEALLEKRMQEFKRRCEDLDRQIKNEKEAIDQEKESIRRQRISLSRVDLSSTGRERRSKSPDRSLGQESVETLTNQSIKKAAQSQDALDRKTGDPPRPPRTRGSFRSKGNVSLVDGESAIENQGQERIPRRESWSEYRKKLPPPPRPPLPRPNLVDSMNYGRSTSSLDLTSVTSATSASMKTALKDSPSTALFRFSPTSSTDKSRDKRRHDSDVIIPSPFIQRDGDTSIHERISLNSSLLIPEQSRVSISPNTVSSASTLYCSDFVDIPFDDDGTLRPGFKSHPFDPKLFYSRIVQEWRKNHPRRILKASSGNLPPVLPSKKFRKEQLLSICNVKPQIPIL